MVPKNYSKQTVKRGGRDAAPFLLKITCYEESDSRNQGVEPASFVGVEEDWKWREKENEKVLF